MQIRAALCHVLLMQDGNSAYLHKADTLASSAKKELPTKVTTVYWSNTKVVGAWGAAEFGQAACVQHN